MRTELELYMSRFGKEAAVPHSAIQYIGYYESMSFGFSYLVMHLVDPSTWLSQNVALSGEESWRYKITINNYNSIENTFKTVLVRRMPHRGDLQTGIIEVWAISEGFLKLVEQKEFYFTSPTITPTEIVEQILTEQGLQLWDKEPTRPLNLQSPYIISASLPLFKQIRKLADIAITPTGDSAFQFWETGGKWHFVSLNTILSQPASLGLDFSDNEVIKIVDFDIVPGEYFTRKIASIKQEIHSFDIYRKKAYIVRANPKEFEVYENNRRKRKEDTRLVGLGERISVLKDLSNYAKEVDYHPIGIDEIIEAPALGTIQAQLLNTIKAKAKINVLDEEAPWYFSAGSIVNVFYPVAGGASHPLYSGNWLIDTLALEGKDNVMLTFELRRNAWDRHASAYMKPSLSNTI